MGQIKVNATGNDLMEISAFLNKKGVDYELNDPDNSIEKARQENRERARPLIRLIFGGSIILMAIGLIAFEN